MNGVPTLIIETMEHATKEQQLAYLKQKGNPVCVLKQDKYIHLQLKRQETQIYVRNQLIDVVVGREKHTLIAIGNIFNEKGE